jgi:hypothetical protein
MVHILHNSERDKKGLIFFIGSFKISKMTDHPVYESLRRALSFLIKNPGVNLLAIGIN